MMHDLLFQLICAQHGIFPSISTVVIYCHFNQNEIVVIVLMSNGGSCATPIIQRQLVLDNFHNLSLALVLSFFCRFPVPIFCFIDMLSFPYFSSNPVKKECYLWDMLSANQSRIFSLMSVSKTQTSSLCQFGEPERTQRAPGDTFDKSDEVSHAWYL